MCHNLSFSTSRRYHTIVFIYPFFYSHGLDTHCTAKELDWRITTIGFANSNHFKIIATKLCSVCYCGADYIWRLAISTFGPLWYQVIDMFEIWHQGNIWTSINTLTIVVEIIYLLNILDHSISRRMEYYMGTFVDWFMCCTLFILRQISRMRQTS